MKTRSVLALLALLVFAGPVHAQEMAFNHKPDDRVMFDLSAEDWVATKTAHVTISIEAAVTAATAGSTRADMMKAVDTLAKADWRLTSFDRNQDQTGMEHWSAAFEARLPENALSGLNESAKKLSKAGMQLTISAIDFSPTLDEMEAARGALRTQIYKLANDQLATLNTTLPGRNYRIALVNFTGDEDTAPMPRVMKGRVMSMAMMAPGAAAAPEGAAPPAERAQKISLTARIVFAATDRPAPPPVPPAGEVKH